MIVAVLRGEELHSEHEVHRSLAEQLDFGGYYGYNIAALRDRLLTDVPRPVMIVWRNASASRAALGKRTFNAIVEVFREAREQDVRWGHAARFDYSLE